MSKKKKSKKKVTRIEDLEKKKKVREEIETLTERVDELYSVVFSLTERFENLALKPGPRGPRGERGQVGPPGPPGSGAKHS